MSWTYRPALDGLRSVAVYLVLVFHAGVAWLGGGFIGVDLFFVLSGFLVTNVLLSEIDTHGRIRLSRFYARRVRRLLPAALVVIVATSVVFMLVASVVRRLLDESPFLHFWSLAIEEQFYAAFPLVLLVLVKASRRRRWVLPVGLAAVCALSLGAQAYWTFADTTWAYYGTDARLYQLVAGALLAVGLRSGARLPGGRTAGAVATGALLAMLVAASDLVALPVSVRGVVAAGLSVAVIGGLMLQQDGVLGRLLARKTPVYLGQVSYGTYLWHWPVILLLEQFLTVRPLVLAALALVLSTSLASLSYQVLELPLRTATFPRPSWSTVGVGLVASAVMAVSVVPATLASERRPRLDALEKEVASVEGTDGSSVSAAARNAPVPPIDYAAYLGGTGPQPSCTRGDPRSCVLVTGDGPHIALVGDSQAKMLGPMFTRLAEERGLTLSVNVLPACPWQVDVINTGLPRARAERCRESRRDWYEQTMPRLDPDLVVLVSGSRDLESSWQGVLVRAGESRGGRERLDDLNFDTITRTVELIESSGPRVLMVNTLPTTGGIDPLECLAGAARLHQCEVGLPRRAPASDAYYRVAAERSDRVLTVDLTSIFCEGAPRCLPVVDGLVVWRDPNHLSVQITSDRRDRVWERITETGALAGL